MTSGLGCFSWNSFGQHAVRLCSQCFSGRHENLSCGEVHIFSDSNVSLESGRETTPANTKLSLAKTIEGERRWFQNPWSERGKTRATTTINNLPARPLRYLFFQA